MAYTVQKTNTEKTVVEAGEYLVRLERSCIKDWTNPETNITKDYLSLMFRICEGQKFANQCLFLAIYRDETGDFAFKRLSNMLETLGYPEGTEFKSLEEVLTKLDNREYLAVVKVDDKKPDRNYISYFKSVPQVTATENSNTTFDITDDDLPF